MTDTTQRPLHNGLRHPLFDPPTLPGMPGVPEDLGFPGELEEPLRPVNWNDLSAEEAEAEWLDLNAWVHWLRRTYGLPPAVVPPLWHRHDELVWELSALHLAWRNAYHPDAHPTALLAWHRDFAESRHRLREWVSTCGTRLDRDRPTRHTAWPGEEPPDGAPERVIGNREEDFVAFVLADVTARASNDAVPRYRHF